MKRFGTSLMAAVGIAIVTATLTFTSGAPAIAQGAKPLLAEIVNDAAHPVPVTSAIPAADRVQLELGPANSGCQSSESRTARRIFADGTEESPFTVPPGRALVLTDLYADATVGVTPWTVGRVVRVVATIESGAFPPRMAATAQLDAAAVLTGIVPVSLHLESGLVGGAGGLVCLGAGLESAGWFATALIQRAQLHGYLIEG